MDGARPSNKPDILMCEKVNVALVQLAEPVRNVLVMRYYDKRSDWAICRAMGVRPVRYSQHMKDARAMLWRVVLAL